MQSQKWQNDLSCFQGKPLSFTVTQVYAPATNTEEAEWFYEDPQDLLQLTLKTDVLFIIRHWNANVGSQETTGVTGKFGLGVQNKGKGQQSFAKRMHWSQQALSSNSTREDYTWTSPEGQYWNQIDHIFAAKDEAALYSQQKQDQELTVAQIMSSLSPN